MEWNTEKKTWQATIKTGRFFCLHTHFKTCLLCSPISRLSSVWTRLPLLPISRKSSTRPCCVRKFKFKGGFETWTKCSTRRIPVSLKRSILHWKRKSAGPCLMCHNLSINKNITNVDGAQCVRDHVNCIKKVFIHEKVTKTIKQIVGRRNFMLENDGFSYLGDWMITPFRSPACSIETSGSESTLRGCCTMRSYWFAPGRILEGEQMKEN